MSIDACELKGFEHKCVLEVCVHIHPIMFFFFYPHLKSPFSNQAVLRFLSEWCSSVQAPPPHNIWLTWPSYLRPTLSEVRAVRLRCRGRQECLDWGILLLDVIMNIAVVLYSWHLSRWRCRGITLLSIWRECANPDLPKCVCSCKLFVIQLCLQKKWV